MRAERRLTTWSETKLIHIGRWVVVEVQPTLLIGVIGLCYFPNWVLASQRWVVGEKERTDIVGGIAKVAG